MFVDLITLLPCPTPPCYTTRKEVVMAHFIRDFYYGKCEPQARSEQGGDMLKLSERLDEKEEFLNERLDGDVQDTF